MIYHSIDMETNTVLNVAFGMCTAARTAPKAKGIDNIKTMVLTGADKDALADTMDGIGQSDAGRAFFSRDAKNVRAAIAVVLIGVDKKYAGLNGCGMCGFADCAACAKAGGRCAFNTIDMGIAIGSAVSYAADHRVDNRVMFSIGKTYMLEHPESDIIWHGIPLFATGKSPAFDRG